VRRWRKGFTVDDMKKCRWLKPQLVAAIEFFEWTPDKDLRHPQFVGVRDEVCDKHYARVNRRTRIARNPRIWVMERRCACVT
jgi:ATP-dependent DNA ligase